MSRQKLVEAFILEVQYRPAIWNKQSGDFKDLRVKDNAWDDILANLAASLPDNEFLPKILGSVDEARKFWRNLKDTYVRKKREAKGKSGAGLKDVKQPKKEWPFFEMLQFLDQSDTYAFGIEGESSQVATQSEGFEEDEEGEEEEDESLQFSEEEHTANELDERGTLTHC